MQPEELEDRRVDFAVRIGNIVDALPHSRLGWHIAEQIVRSGTSPAPNDAEGYAAEELARLRSQVEHQPEGATRDADLAAYHSQGRTATRAARLVDLLDETDQLCRIIASSILTARRNGRSH